jgi:Tol biopolymer transport system component
VADSEGSRASALTNFDRGYSGSPRWSPDGQTIVFDARPDGASDIYSVRSGGGEPKRLTDHPAEDHVPCFSNDGRWIYFSSTRSGTRQIYRMPAEGGTPVQITRGGAFAAVATDGNWLYYARGGPSQLWKTPVEGGEESRVSESVMSNALSFGVTRLGVYFVSRTLDPAGLSLKMYRFSDSKLLDIGRFEKLPFLQLAISPDEKWLLFTRLDSQVNDLMLVENFR